MEATQSHIKTEKLVPQLRFPQFESQWQVKTLESICSKKISYGIVQAGEHVVGGMPYIKSQNLNNPLNINLLERTSAEIAAKYVRSEVKPGDIIFSLRGNIGIVQILPESIPTANLTQGTARISVGPEESNGFVLQAMRTLKNLKEILSYSKGSTFQEISLTDLRKVRITTPSLPEQQKIASFLSAVDEKIQQLSRKKALLEQYKKGVMQQIFSQQIRFKNENGNSYPDWEEKRLGELISIFNGYAFSSTDSQDSGCKWVKIADVGITEMKTDNISFLPSNFKDKHSKFVLKKGEYVIALTRPILDGKLKIAKIDDEFDGALLNQRVGKLETKYSTHFMYYLLQLRGLIARIESRIAGTDPPNLSAQEMNGIKILITTNIEEQQRIADHLATIENRINLLKRNFEQLAEFKKGLLQKMFV